MSKYRIELESKLNQSDFSVLADLMTFYDKYEYTDKLQGLERKIESIHKAYIDDLKQLTDDAEVDLAYNFGHNNNLIESGKETYYSWHDAKEFTKILTKQDIIRLKQENKCIRKLNLSLTNFWLKLLKSKLSIILK